MEQIFKKDGGSFPSSLVLRLQGDLAKNYGDKDTMVSCFEG